MVQGRDRRPELGYKLALECRYKYFFFIKYTTNLNVCTDSPDFVVTSCATILEKGGGGGGGLIKG